MLKVRRNLKQYERDTYLSEKLSSIKSNTDVIDCEVGYSPFGCSPQMLKEIKEIDFSAVARYPEMFYSNLLKPAILKRFDKANLRLGNIFFGHGSFNLAERVIHKLIIPESMLGYGPQFNEIPSEMEAAGGRYKPIPMLESFRFPFSQIMNELKREGYSVVYLDNPNNPTGFLIPLEVLEEIVCAAERKGTIVLIDEAYGDFVADTNSAFSLVCKYSNVIVIRSFSKALGLAAQRVGYMAISDKLVPYYSKLDVPFEPTLISAILAKMTLQDVDYIDKVRKLSRECKRKIESVLSDVGIGILPTNPEVSILMAHKFQTNLSACFSEIGVRVENGAAYSKTNNSIDNSFIRIRVPNLEQTDKMVRRIKKAF